MKKVYTFTLNDEDIPSVEVKSDIKLIAYWLADAIVNMSEEDQEILVLNENLHDNFIYDTIENNHLGYSLESDSDLQHYYKYNPTILDDVTFAITVYENRIKDNEVLDLFNQTLKEIQEVSHIKLTSSNFLITTSFYEKDTKRHKTLEEFKKRINAKRKKRIRFTKTLASNILK